MSKGHVPEENLARYRRLRDLSHLLERMGNQLSGMGEYDDANKLYAVSAKYRDRANELRADLPEQKEGNQ